MTFRGVTVQCIVALPTCPTNLNISLDLFLPLVFHYTAPNF